MNTVFERDPEVLIVDDDDRVLTSLRRNLRGAPFRVRCARDGREALMLLEQGKADVVLSDYRMPDMDGVRFLEIVSRQYPRTRRLLLTGYADMDLIIASYSRAKVHRFLTKPWDPVRLRRILEEQVGSLPGPVLLVDDGERPLAPLARLVEQSGRTVTVVPHPDHLRERMAELHPSGILSPIYGPDFNATMVIRAAMGPPPVPVIFLAPTDTSVWMLEVAPDARSFCKEYVEFLTEPVDDQSLLAGLRTRFARRREE